MKYLIVYSTKNGATYETARIISKELGNDSKIAEIKKMDTHISNYDYIIIGTPLYFGKIPAEVIKFVKQNELVLIKKKLSIYVHGMLSENRYTFILKDNLGTHIVNHCDHIQYLGGKVDVRKFNPVFRFLFKKLAARKNMDINNTNTISAENIRSFINAVKGK